MTMRRVIAVMLVVAASGGLRVATPPVSAQPVLAQRYEDRVCGFAFQYPDGWVRLERDDRIAAVGYAEPLPTLALVGPVWDVQGQASSELISRYALLISGQNCLDCLRESLVWIDRFADGPTVGTYTISRVVFNIGGQPVPYYNIDYVLYTEGTGRVQGPAGWTVTSAVFRVPIAIYRQMEPVVNAMVRSIRFTVPERTCWS